MSPAFSVSWAVIILLGLLAAGGIALVLGVVVYLSRSPAAAPRGNGVADLRAELERLRERVERLERRSGPPADTEPAPAFGSPEFIATEPRAFR